MADVISQNAYEAILRIPEPQRTQKMVDAVNDFLNAKYNIPPKKDYQKAIAVLNAVSKRPHTHTFSQEQIDWAKQIEQQDREGRALMSQNEQNGGYIRDVKRVPDDIGKEYGFKFNWKSAYENETGEKLRPNEADAKKLEQYISNKVSDYEKGEDLRKTANDMKMYSNKELNSWSNFIGSDSNNSKEFQNYLKDMQKIQKDKRLDEIWNKESNMAVDFMLPVSKEYARKNYENINGASDMVKPIATDALANAAMMMGGESLPMKVASMGAAPLITEGGNVVLNDKPLNRAAAHALEGSLINMGTPFFLGRGSNLLARGFGNSEKNIARDIMNNAANASDKVKREIRNGKPYEIDGDWFKENRKGRLTAIYTDNPEKYTKAEQKLIKPLDELPNEGVSTIERENARNWEQFRRGLSKDEQARANLDRSLEDIMYGSDRKALQTKKQASLRNKGNISELSPSDIRQLGIREKETITNYIVRNIRNKTPEEAKNYIQNLAGRDKSARAYGSWLNSLFGTDLFRGESKKQDTNKLIKLYGLDQD